MATKCSKINYFLGNIYLVRNGWCMHFATDFRKKISLFVLFLLCLIPFSLEAHLSRILWLLIGGTMLLWVKSTPFPKRIRSVAVTLGGFSYMIYITHMAFAPILNNIWTLGSLGVASVFALLGPILLCFSFAKARQWWTRLPSTGSFLQKRRAKKAVR
jgi:hypothetical protein